MVQVYLKSVYNMDGLSKSINMTVYTLQCISIYYHHKVYIATGFKKLNYV